MAFASSVLSDQNVTQQVQECLKSVFNTVRDIDNARNQFEKNWDRVSHSNSGNNHGRLKELLTAVKDTQLETELLRKALDKIHEIRTIKNERRLQARHSGYKQIFRRGIMMKNVQVSAQTLPLWVGDPDEKAPPLCGAIPAESNYIAKPGDMVAALVTGTGEDGANWILAEVVKFNRTTHKYDVVDIDEEQKEQYSLSKSLIVPLPLMRANPGTDMHALFPAGSVVMALYPQTTCFYKAVVKELPMKSTDEYELLFEDPSYPDGYSPPLPVAQRYVFAVKDRKKV